MDPAEEKYARKSLKNFRKRFPNEKACLRVFPAICRCCGKRHDRKIINTRVFTCTRCNAETWRTAGTFFRRLRRLMPAFALIWLHEDHAVMSINKFKEYFDLSYDSAWNLFNKFEALLENEFDKQQVIELIAAVFIPVTTKRSTLSFSGKRASFEEEEVKIEPEEFEKMDDDQRTVSALLKPQPTDYDTLFEMSGLSVDKFTAALMALELNGVATEHFGSRFSLTKTNPMMLVGSQESMIIEHFFDHVTRNFHGISRKYLQRKLVAFGSRFALLKWSGGTLLKTCLQSPPSRLDQRNYKSPRMVRVPLPFWATIRAAA